MIGLGSSALTVLVAVERERSGLDVYRPQQR